MLEPTPRRCATSTVQDRVITPRREQWVDSLRVLVITGVIVVHTATAYVVDIAGWYYDDERTESDVWSTLVTIPVFFGALFALGPLFVLAGWFAARSMVRRAPAGFARSRLLRLGLPIVLFVLVIQPLSDYVGNLQSESRSLAHYLASTELSVMWFAAAVLAFSLVYAAWEHLRPGAMRPRPHATYFIHPLVLTTIMVLFAWAPLPPEVKFVLVGGLAIPVCFVVGYLLTRAPGLSKVL